MPSRRTELGRVGELAARRFLQSRGLRVVAQNVRTRYGEIDLVCQAGDSLVFVEVKTRSAEATVGPLEAVSPAKAERLVRLAQAYMMDQEEAEGPWRIDVVAVLVDPSGRVISVSHLPSAITADETPSALGRGD